MRAGGPGSYAKNSELDPKSPTLGRRPIHVCFREKSGHRILSASSPFMTRTRHPRAEAVSRTAHRSVQDITLVPAGFIAPPNDPMALNAAEDERARNMH